LIDLPLARLFGGEIEAEGRRAGREGTAARSGMARDVKRYKSRNETRTMAAPEIYRTLPVIERTGRASGPPDRSRSVTRGRNESPIFRETEEGGGGSASVAELNAAR